MTIDDRRRTRRRSSRTARERSRTPRAGGRASVAPGDVADGCREAQSWMAKAEDRYGLVSGSGDFLDLCTTFVADVGARLARGTAGLSAQCAPAVPPAPSTLRPWWTRPRGRTAAWSSSRRSRCSPDASCRARSAGGDGARRGTSRMPTAMSTGTMRNAVCTPRRRRRRRAANGARPLAMPAATEVRPGAAVDLAVGGDAPRGRSPSGDCSPRPRPVTSEAEQHRHRPTSTATRWRSPTSDERPSWPRARASGSKRDDDAARRRRGRSRCRRRSSPARPRPPPRRARRGRAAGRCPTA